MVTRVKVSSDLVWSSSCKIWLLLVVSCRRMMEKGPKTFWIRWDSAPPPLAEGVIPRNTPLPTCHRAEIGRSRSKGMSIFSRSRSRSSEPIRIDRLPMTYSYVTVTIWGLVPLPKYTAISGEIRKVFHTLRAFNVHAEKVPLEFCYGCGAQEKQL